MAGTWKQLESPLSMASRTTASVWGAGSAPLGHERPCGVVGRLPKAAGHCPAGPSSARVLGCADAPSLCHPTPRSPRGQSVPRARVCRSSPVPGTRHLPLPRGLQSFLPYLLWMDWIVPSPTHCLQVPGGWLPATHRQRKPRAGWSSHPPTSPEARAPAAAASLEIALQTSVSSPDPLADSL